MKQEEKMFCLFPEIFGTCKVLSDEQFGILMRALVKYHYEGVAYSGEDQIIQVIFSFAAGQIDRYEEHRRKNKERASLGGKRKAELQRERLLRSAEAQLSSTEQDLEEEEPAYSASQSQSHSHPYPETQPKNQSHAPYYLGWQPESQSRQAESRVSQDFPPTVDAVWKYCRENGYKINPEHFVRYYEATGWKTGNNPIRDWKALVRNWNENEKEIQTQKKEDNTILWDGVEYELPF